VCVGAEDGDDPADAWRAAAATGAVRGRY